MAATLTNTATPTSTLPTDARAHRLHHALQGLATLSDGLPHTTVQFDANDLYAIFAVMAEEAGQLYADIIDGG